MLVTSGFWTKGGQFWSHVITSCFSPKFTSSTRLLTSFNQHVLPGSIFEGVFFFTPQRYLYGQGVQLSWAPEARCKTLRKTQNIPKQTVSQTAPQSHLGQYGDGSGPSFLISHWARFFFYIIFYITCLLSPLKKRERKTLSTDCWARHPHPPGKSPISRPKKSTFTMLIFSSVQLNITKVTYCLPLHPHLTIDLHKWDDDILIMTREDQRRNQLR